VTRRRALIVAATLAIAAVIAFWIARRPSPTAATAVSPTQLFTRDDDVLDVRSIAAVGAAEDRLLRLRLTSLVASLTGYDSAEVFARMISDQLGFDPRRRAEVLKTGIDPDRPLAIGRPRGQGVVAVLPVADADTLQRAIANLASARFGATPRSHEPGILSDRTLFSRGSDPPVLALESTASYVTVMTGAALAERRRGTALGLSPDYEEAKRELGDSLFLGYFPPGSEDTAALHLPHGGALSINVGPTAIEFSGVTRPASDMAAQLAVLNGSAGDDLLGWLDPDAFAVIGFGGDLATLRRVWEEFVPENYRRMLATAGIDVPVEILGNLKPGSVVSLALAPTASLAQMPELDLRLTNPFQFLHVTGIGRVKDGARAQKTLERLAGVAPAIGASVKMRSVRGVAVQTFSYHLGETASLALKGEYALVTGGPGRMDALLARMEAAPASPSRLLKDLHVQGFALRVDVTRLVDAVRALPPSAYGVGGFAISAAVNRWMDALAEVERIDLGARIDNGRAHGRLRLQLAPSAQP
jgi:hypothetical protein